MSRALILDSEALSSLSSQQGRRFAETRAALEAARRLRRDVIVPAVILAELYRGPKQNQVVDSCLSRETGLDVRDTDRDVARLVGAVLGAAGAGTEDLADAHCVAAAVEAGGGVVVTGDERDLGRLAAPYPNVQISPI
ncbi:MAG: type II toxin-antitoxin system VapC family toxin [Actinomycetota bacterium]